LINLSDSKTGKKTIVMSAATADLLKDSVRRGTFVVPGLDADRSRSGLQKPWRAVQRHARLEGVRIHDLRHTFASIGAARAQVSDFLSSASFLAIRSQRPPRAMRI
jgi:integrase